MQTLMIIKGIRTTILKSAITDEPRRVVVNSEYLRHWKKRRLASEHRASSSLKISVGNIKDSDYVTNLPSKSSSSAHDVKHYGRQCEPSGTGEYSMNVTRQHMGHDPMIPVVRVRADLCTPERNVRMIQHTSENLYGSKQPLTSGTRTEQVISIKICELFSEMQTKLEEDGLQINSLRMRHIEHTNTFNKIVDAINEHIDLKCTISHASVPKELTSVVPPAMVRQEEEEVNEEAEEESGHHEEEENKVAKTKHNSRGWKFTLPPEYDPKDSRWTMRYREPALNIVELIKSSGVYVNKFNLSNIQRLSKDCKSLARMMMLEIFSDNALKVCSLTGARPKSSDEPKVRPGLDEHARKVLLTYVETYGRKQGWCTSDKQALTISLRNKLQEIRQK
uniref:BEN domain-containing protein n=1 Tax=Glyptapanteles flavicoxis TaxID=463051 RepID=B7S8C8_9HYME|nr:conserved hypothetical protein [Glyptapanteles flavicoxis]